MSSENWNKIVKEYDGLIGRQFFDKQGTVYRFFGLVHGNDDFYYGLMDSETSKVSFISCVGRLEESGYTLTYDYKKSD